MAESFIVDAIRTPIGKYGGSLSTVRCDDLAAIPIRELVKRNPTIDLKAIEEVYLGCANQAGEDNRNVARMASLLAGLPASVAACTVNRLCASGLTAAVFAHNAIKQNEGKLYIAGGVEHMSRAPFVMGKSERAFGRAPDLYDTTLGWRFVNPQIEATWGIDSMGQTAENLAELYSISRAAQDEFAYSSQVKAKDAQNAGHLAQEIVPVSIPQRKGADLVFSEDEFPRHDTTMEKLSKLRAVFREDGGTVTAGNSSGLNDGAAALLLASESAVKEYSLKSRARIVACAVAGVEPRIMGIGPVYASRKALKRAGLELKQMDVIELNEAFSAQSLACLQELGIDRDDTRVNRYGGAIALGHPLGMSGARLLATAVAQLHDTNGRYALCSLCVGVGQGTSVIIERV
jgi:acetyl-CoA acyltransferase